MHKHTHKHTDYCAQCRYETHAKRAEYWEDVADFIGMALAIIVLVACAILWG